MQTYYALFMAKPEVGASAVTWITLFTLFQASTFIENISPQARFLGFQKKKKMPMEVKYFKILTAKKKKASMNL